MILLSCIPVRLPCKKKCSGSIQWNGSIRFFVEAYFDFAMLVSINLKYTDWESPFKAVIYSNTLSTILQVVTVLLSIIILVFYYMNRELWSMPEFQRKFNTLLEGFIVTSASKWQVVAMIALFMLKRATFVVVVMYMDKALPIQICLI